MANEEKLIRIIGKAQSDTSDFPGATLANTSYGGRFFSINLYQVGHTNKFYYKLNLTDNERGYEPLQTKVEIGFWWIDAENKKVVLDQQEIIRSGNLTEFPAAITNGEISQLSEARYLDDLQPGSYFISLAYSFPFIFEGLPLHENGAIESDFFLLKIIQDNTNGDSKIIQYYFLEEPFSIVNPTREGYTFRGWKNENEVVGSGQQIKWSNWNNNYITWQNENGQWVWRDKHGYLIPLVNDETYTITLEAIWEPNLYTVYFNSNYGTSCSPITVQYDAKYDFVPRNGPTKKLPIPSRIGCKFLGWYLGSTQITDEEGNALRTVKTASNHTLKAHWEALGSIKIYNEENSKWETALPYIYIRNEDTDKLEWRQAIPYIYNGEKWFTST